MMNSVLQTLPDGKDHANDFEKALAGLDAIVTSALFKFAADDTKEIVRGAIESVHSASRGSGPKADRDVAEPR